MAGLQGRGGGGVGARRPHATSRRRAEEKREKDQGEGRGDKRGLKVQSPYEVGRQKESGWGGGLEG